MKVDSTHPLLPTQASNAQSTRDDMLRPTFQMHVAVCTSLSWNSVGASSMNTVSAICATEYHMSHPSCCHSMCNCSGGEQLEQAELGCSLILLRAMSKSLSEKPSLRKAMLASRMSSWKVHQTSPN
jgi:hypothetical protein